MPRRRRSLRQSGLLTGLESRRFADRLVKLIELQLQAKLSTASKRLLFLSADAWRDRTEIELSPSLSELDENAREAIGEALIRSALYDAHLQARKKKKVRFQDLFPALSDAAKRAVGILDPRDKGF
jgi:hypothetical protein